MSGRGGTGSFLLAAYDYFQNHYQLDRDQKRFQREDALRGVDIVGGVVRLCAMNLYLRGIGGEESPVVADDSLRSLGSTRYDVVLTTPPFGKKSSYTVLGADGRAVSESQAYECDDIWATTSNKQLNFLQHVKSLLKIGGTAAVVPDNVLFEGGAGETARRRLLREYDVHTLLRLPTGIFYAQGVKANVPRRQPEHDEAVPGEAQGDALEHLQQVLVGAHHEAEMAQLAGLREWLDKFEEKVE